MGNHKRYRIKSRCDNKLTLRVLKIPVVRFPSRRTLRPRSRRCGTTSSAVMQPQKRRTRRCGSRSWSRRSDRSSSRENRPRSASMGMRSMRSRKSRSTSRRTSFTVGTRPRPWHPTKTTPSGRIGMPSIGMQMGDP